jgi:HAE1 family hydrophobic/amphiphilic exporter-1
MLHLYDVSLQWVLRYRPVTMVVFFIVLIATAWLFMVIPKGFIPDQDTDQMFAVIEGAQGSSFDQMSHYQSKVADVLATDQRIESFVSTVGGANSATMGGPNFGQLVVHLKPRHERKMLVGDMIASLRPEFAEIEGVHVYPQNPPTIRIGGLVTKSLYQFTLVSPNKEELYDTARRLSATLADEPSLQDVTSNLLVESPQVNITIDRDKAAALQVNAAAIENALYDAYGPRWVSTIYSPVNEYKVLLELLPSFQRDPKALSMLYFKSTSGQLIPLDALASVELETGPQAISHYGQLSAVTVSFDVRPGHALGEAVTRVRHVADEVVPSTISTTFQGAAKAFEGSLGNLWTLLVVAILVVYIVLGILYESYIHPLTILSGLPSAGFGALLTLHLLHMDLNIYAFVGLIMLIGIVKKNAIMQIDFALDAEREGLKPMDAIYHGCLVRFRPIMMTTMAALLGAVPIAIGYGAGGEARQPLGVVVVGGLLFSQLVTLYLTPVFYTYLSSAQEWWRNRRRKGKGVRRHEEPIPVEVHAAD